MNNPSATIIELDMQELSYAPMFKTGLTTERPES